MAHLKRFGDKASALHIKTFEEAFGLLKQRSFWGWFFLTIITCGIYGLYWVYITTKSVNQLAQGDNRDFSPVLAVGALHRHLRHLSHHLVLHPG